ncbi:MAG: hypothetical protein ABIH66_03515 [bacterium]
MKKTKKKDAQRRAAQSRRAKGESIPWDEIRLAYITRPDRPSFYRLEMEFGLGDKTVQRRGKREGWGQKRDEHHNGVVTEAQKKIGEKQTIDLAKTIEMLNGLLERLNWELDGAKANSLEGLAREIRETIKTLNVYLVQPTDRIELKAAQKAELNEVLDWMEEASAEMYVKFRRAVEGERRTEENL